MFTAFVVASLVLASAEPPKAGDKKPELSEAALKELKKLEGKWQFVKVVGKDVEGDLDDADSLMVFEGGKVSITFGPQKYTADVTALDPGTAPKCLDVTVTSRNRTVISEGIYKLDGDTLVYANTPNGEKLRPAGFDKPTDARVQVFTLKRVKK